METRKILLLVLALGMIQDQTLVASKHYLVETEDYLVDQTKGKIKDGKGAETVSSSIRSYTSIIIGPIGGSSPYVEIVQ